MNAKLMEIRVEWPEEMNRPTSVVRRMVHFSSEPILWLRLHRKGPFGVLSGNTFYTGGKRTLTWIRE